MDNVEIIGLSGIKMKMTQLLTPEGEIGVTPILVPVNVVSQEKRIQGKDGYDSLQLAWGECRSKVLNKPKIGHLAKNGISPHKHLQEIRNMKGFKTGSQLDLSLFQGMKKINVTAISKGKGTQGVIKRHNQARGPMSHGSGYHRGVGSMGSIAPNRILPGKKLPGRMGNNQVTTLNLLIVKIYKNVILVKGSVPGTKNRSLVKLWSYKLSK